MLVVAPDLGGLNFCIYIGEVHFWVGCNQLTSSTENSVRSTRDLYARLQEEGKDIL